MTALNIFERIAAPAVATLMLAGLPLALVGFFTQGF
jgi:hypothetical membrane protein